MVHMRHLFIVLCLSEIAVTCVEGCAVFVECEVCKVCLIGTTVHEVEGDAPKRELRSFLVCAVRSRQTVWL